ncbi:MAG TPA: hypothetical protein VKE93_07575 [Candidatus Angelobacter sp.]|nr:hypothetical protein [Candidatus Angelobacter sp.]
MTALSYLALVLGSEQAYNLSMAKPKSETLEVGCPCCGAVLKIDPATHAVISHVAPVKPKMFADFDSAAKAMREQEGRKESLFQQAVNAEKNKADVLEKKFQEAMKKAKESPEEGPMIRDFDLD